MEKNDFSNYINLAAEKLGACAIACSDDFFASMHNLVKPGRGVFIEGKYTENGKWMDGWESRRKRVAGHDWCIIRLGEPGVIHGLDIDTNHFLGNHPPHCSIDACMSQEEYPQSDSWTEILTKSKLDPGQQHLFKVDNPQIYSHVRLNIYPDGGVARLKVFGQVIKDWSRFQSTELIDLAAANNGAKAIACNDMFFSHMDNLIMPGRGINMGDGWETKRNREPENRDWVVIRLAQKGEIGKITVDTGHFKGNYPDACMLEGCALAHDRIDEATWHPILPQMKLSADAEHTFEREIINKEAVTHVRLSIFPDGGISRLRLWGKIVSL